MKKVRRIFIKLIVVTGVFLMSSMSVKAKNYAPAPDTFKYKYLSNGKFCYNINTANIYYASRCGSDYYELVKYADFGGQSNAIYCAEWDKHIDAGATFKKYPPANWNPKSERAIVSGYLSYNSNKNNEIKKEIYSEVGVLLNHYLATCSKPLAGSHKFNNIKSEYAAKIREAINYYNSIKNNINQTKLKAPTFSVKSPQLSGSGNTYKTGTITVSNLNTTQYGASVGYVINVTTNNSNAKVRLGSSGGYESSISKNITSSIPSSGKYSFVLYIQGDNIADTKVNVKISATSSSDYYTSYLYYSTRTSNSTQRLLYPGKMTVNRSSQSQITAIVPEMNRYSLYINKVDEDGEILKNARFKITYNGNPVTLSNNDGTYYWKSAETTSTYDFSKFALTEVTAPSGYIYEGDTIRFDDLSSGETCLDNLTNEEEDDKELCHSEDYSYLCVSENSTSIDPDSGGNCVSPDSQGGGDSQPDSPAVEYTKICRKVGSETRVDDKYCESSGKYTKFVLKGNSLSVTVTNKKNTVIISKKAITGDDEVPGAELKICTKNSYNTKKNDCDVAKDVSGNDLSWVSTSIPQEFMGIPAGNYVIVETIAPNGYSKLTSGTEFSINDEGKVSGKTVKKIDDNDVVIVKNAPNDMTISKTDVTSTRELPGATLRICRAITVIDGDSSDEESGTSGEGEPSEEYETADDSVQENDNYSNNDMVIDKNTGECIPVVLADGSKAEWVSTNEPKKISGLPSGTYYLVETIAPKGYALAESIKFVMNEDGTLSDVNGNSLSDNKLVMKDNIVEVPNTLANVSLFMSIIGWVLALASFGSLGYMVMKKKI